MTDANEPITFVSEDAESAAACTPWNSSMRRIDRLQTMVQVLTWESVRLSICDLPLEDLVLPVYLPEEAI